MLEMDTRNKIGNPLMKISGFFIGALRCGNKPLVLPGGEKRAKLQ
jgi:hypothetical protein